MSLHLERPQKGGFSLWTWGERYMWLVLSGPGRVAIQSAYAPRARSRRPITGGYVTERQW